MKYVLVVIFALLSGCASIQREKDDRDIDSLINQAQERRAQNAEYSQTNIGYCARLLNTEDKLYSDACWKSLDECSARVKEKMDPDLGKFVWLLGPGDSCFAKSPGTWRVGIE